MNKLLQPLIKWSGSKRSQAPSIISHFPKKIKTYYEPFLGGGSILLKLLTSNISVENYIVSDLNVELISLWNLIKNKPLEVSTAYAEYWGILKAKETQTLKQDFYNEIRAKFNENKDPVLFLFLTRTCFNGLIRYNYKKEFNSPFHLNRDGIEPKKLMSSLLTYQDKLQKVDFISCDYSKIIPDDHDFTYLDPPYLNTKGQYFNEFDFKNFCSYLSHLKCKFILSFDGKTNSKDFTAEIPASCYIKHLYLESGKSSFRRLKGNNEMVYESLYLNF